MHKKLKKFNALFYHQNMGPLKRNLKRTLVFKPRTFTLKASNFERNCTRYNIELETIAKEQSIHQILANKIFYLKTQNTLIFQVLGFYMYVVFNLFSNTEAKKHSTIPQTQKQNKKNCTEIALIYASFLCDVGLLK